MAVTVETYKDRMKKNLPTFVDVNSIIVMAFVTTVAKSLYSIYLAVTGLTNAYWTWKGLKLTADENRILYKSDITDFDLQDELKNRYSILGARGTEAGIEDDISNIDLVLEPDVEFFGYDSTGWVLDLTYPEASVGNNMIYFLDAMKIVKMNFATPFTYGYAIWGQFRWGQHISQYKSEIEKLAEHMIIPADSEIIYE
ncbi:MAG: hypothetical protein A2V66_10740 [Ignavibacteria bacterium RBG_13_36_8]|nr:MAG: hypothetical protein A2V66_10740 [Ignavibacteria bacterium RBG_13_36_8]